MSENAQVSVIPDKQAPIKLGITNIALKKLEEKYKKVPDATTKEGYEAIKEAKRELVPLRTGVQKECKLQTAAAVEHQRRVNKVANEIIERVKAIEKPMYDAKQKVDDAAAEKKRQELLAEQNRVEDIKELINEIMSLTEGLLNAPSSTIEERLAAATAISITTMEYMEFTEQASAELTRVKEQLTTAVETTKAMEAQQKAMDERQAKLDAAADKQQTKLDEAAKKQRLEDDERQRLLDEQQDRLDAQQKAIDDAAEKERLRKAAEELAELKKKADAAKAAELAARMPEDQKLRKFADELNKLEVPLVDSEALIEVRGEVLNDLVAICDCIYQNTQDPAA